MSVQESTLDDPLVPLKEAAFELRVSVRTMHRMIAADTIPYVQLVPRGRLYLLRSDIRRLVLSRLKHAESWRETWGTSPR